MIGRIAQPPLSTKMVLGGSPAVNAGLNTPVRKGDALASCQRSTAPVANSFSDARMSAVPGNKIK